MGSVTTEALCQLNEIVESTYQYTETVSVCLCAETVDSVTAGAFC